MNFVIVDSGLSRFQNPSFLLHLKALWTWAALIIAAIATFNSLIRRSTRILLRIRKGKSVISLPPLYTSDDEFYYSDDDESSDDGEDDDELVTSSDSEKDFGDFEESQGINGESGHDFEWPELARGDGSVVKLWDHGRSFLLKSDEIKAVHLASPALVLLAGREGVKVWDARAGSAGPAVSASVTWEAEGMGRVVRIRGEDYSKVYVGDDVGRVRVVDLRNVRSTSAESWWHCDCAVTEGDCHGGDGLVSWCRSAARCWNLSDSLASWSRTGPTWE